MGDWSVDCWGSFADTHGTEVFDTEIEARNHFNKIARTLRNNPRYTITSDSIVDNEDKASSINITNLAEL